MFPKRLVLALAFLLAFARPAVAEGGHPPPDTSTAAAPDAPKCGHGVAKKLCTRCNPKLAPVFKARGDWCAEHERPESQCALCHPELARKGVK
jgi:hypothetical protein